MSWEDILKSNFREKLLQFINTHREEIYNLHGIMGNEPESKLNFIEDTYSDRKAFNTWMQIANAIKQKGNNPTWLLEPENWNIPDRWLKGRN